MYVMYYYVYKVIQIRHSSLGSRTEEIRESLNWGKVAQFNAKPNTVLII